MDGVNRKVYLGDKEVFPKTPTTVSSRTAKSGEARRRRERTDSLQKRGRIDRLQQQLLVTLPQMEVRQYSGDPSQWLDI